MVLLPFTWRSAAMRSLATAAALSQSTPGLNHLATPFLVRYVLDRCWSAPLDLWDADHLFDEMSSAWPRPYTRSFNLLLSRTLDSGHPHASLSFHSRMVHGAGVSPDRYTFGISINCCRQLGALGLAFGFFCDMMKRCCLVDTVVLSCLVDGLCAEGRIGEALKVLERMPEMGCAPDGALYSGLVGWCCELNGVEFGEGVFCGMLKHGVCADTIALCVLMDGLCGDGRIWDATKVFERMLEMGCAPDVVTFSVLIGCCCNLSMVDLGMGFLCQMLKQGCRGNVVVFTTLMDGLCNANRVVDALEVFKRMVEMRCLVDVVMYGTLIDNVCWLGRVDLGFVFFCDMLKRGCEPNTVILTSLINGFCKMNWIREAVALFKKMPEIGIPANATTYSCLIDCFCRLSCMKSGLGIFCDLLKQGHHLDMVVLTSLIHGHRKAFKIVDAASIFSKMPEMGCAPDDVTYGALIDCCCHLGRVDLGFGLFCNMLKQGICSYTSILNILVHGLCLENEALDAAELIERMPKGGYMPNAITYGALIKCLCRNQGVNKALELHNRMATSGSCCRPNVVTYTTIIGRLVKEGNMNDALKLLKEMDDEGISPNSVTYRHMIYGFSALGNWEDAAQIFHEVFHRGAFKIDQSGLQDRSEWRQRIHAVHLT